MMNNFKFGKSSEECLDSVDPVLKLVAQVALKHSPVDFSVYSGYRTAEEQNKLFKDGKSNCDGYKVESKHQSGLAIDVVGLVGNKASWGQPTYQLIDVAFKRAAFLLDVPIEWGGNWTTFVDMPHFELTRPYKAWEFKSIEYKAQVALRDTT